jgi:endonuclease IV
MRYGLHLSMSKIPEFMKNSPGISVAQVFMGSPQGFYPAKKYVEDKDLIARIRGWMKDLDMELVAHAPYVISVYNHQEKSLESCKRLISSCLSLGVKRLVVHSGSWEPDQKPAEIWIDFLNKLTGMYNEDELVFLLETMSHSKSMNAPQLNDVCNHLGRKVGVCYDTVHSWTCPHDMSTLEAKHVRTVHLNQTKSLRGSCADLHGDVHLLDPNGTIPECDLKHVVKWLSPDEVVSEFSIDNENWRDELSQVRRVLEI